MTLLSSNRKDAVFQDSNWKVDHDETSWNKVYWIALKEQFVDKYHDDFRTSSRRKQISRIDDLDLLLIIDISSFEENQNDLHLYRKQNKSKMKNEIIRVSVIIKSIIVKTKKTLDNILN